MRWLRAQSIQVQTLVIVMVSIAIGCVALPLSVHHMTLARIREANLDAIRFAAVAPEQLRSLPVTAWHDGPKIAAPRIQKTGWEQYQMSLPHGEITTVIDVDLRGTMLPLMLGFGGWLRIAAMIVVSGVAAYFLLKYGCGWRAIIPPPLRGGGQGEGESEDKGRGGKTSRQDPSHETPLLFNTINHIPHPAFYFDLHHQLAHWNDAAQAAISHLTLSAGIHMLDLSAHLPWGAEMIEKMDEVAQQSAVIIHKGDSLCVIPG